MRLSIKQKDSVINELAFAKGPIYIGRHTHSQVFLSDGSVSRQHAVIFDIGDGKWMLEDLDSANKTYLNGEPIHKSEIETGDVISISEFTIEVNFEDENHVEAEKDIDMEDTLTSSIREMQIIVRKPGAEHAPAMKLPAKRAGDFVQATEAICKADGIERLLLVLLQIAAKQFSAFHVWCALRSEPAGPMTCHAGKSRQGPSVQLEEIKLKEKIIEAIEKSKYMLIPRIPRVDNEEKINSVIIAPIISQAGCFGVLYVDNGMDHEHYSLGDLDYLMLLTIHTASILENF
jgi:pSer/pThr/pTyr-binding forkhead associated (FHA) protein